MLMSMSMSMSMSVPTRVLWRAAAMWRWARSSELPPLSVWQPQHRLRLQLQSWSSPHHHHHHHLHHHHHPQQRLCWLSMPPQTVWSSSQTDSGVRLHQHLRLLQRPHQHQHQHQHWPPPRQHLCARHRPRRVPVDAHGQPPRVGRWRRTPPAGLVVDPATRPHSHPRWAWRRVLVPWCPWSSSDAGRASKTERPSLSQAYRGRHGAAPSSSAACLVPVVSTLQLQLQLCGGARVVAQVLRQRRRCVWQTRARESAGQSKRKWTRTRKWMLMRKWCVAPRDRAVEPSSHLTQCRAKTRGSPHARLALTDGDGSWAWTPSVTVEGHPGAAFDGTGAPA